MSLNTLSAPRFGAVYKLSEATCAEYNNRCNANGGWEQLNVMSNGIPAPMDFLAQKTGDETYREIGRALAQGASKVDIYMSRLLFLNVLPGNRTLLAVTNTGTPDADALRAFQNQARQKGPVERLQEDINQKFIEGLEASGRTIAIV